jgi:hypothetical protein
MIGIQPMKKEIEVGKQYYTHCGNRVQIMASEINQEPDGEKIIFVGRFLYTIRGHEILKNKVHKFFSDGRWTGQNKMKKSIHDLKEEAKI